MTALPADTFLLDDTGTTAVLDSVMELIEENPRAVAEGSFAFFCMYYLPEHFSAGFGKFQTELFEYLQSLQPGHHSLFLFPREHGKSTVFNFAFTIWCTVYRKKIHALIVSSVKETSEKFLGNIKNELQSNQLIIRDFGDLIGNDNSTSTRRPNRSERIRTTNHVVIAATSTNGTVRGTQENLPLDLDEDFMGMDSKNRPIYRQRLARPDLIICDDCVDDKLILTKNTRNRTWDWFWKNLYSSMQAETGNVIVVGTTLHEDDLVSRLWSDQTQTGDDPNGGNGSWFKRKLPAANPDRPFDENGDPIDCLFPEKWGRKDYRRPVTITNPATGETVVRYYSYLWWRAKELGPAFGPEFLMKPVDESTRFFRHEDWGFYVVQTPSIPSNIKQVVFEQTGKLIEDLPADLICVTAVDPAATDPKRVKQGTDPDYTVVATCGYSPTTRKFYVVAVDRLRCSPFVMMQRVLIHLQMFSAQYGGKYVPDASRPDEVYLGFPFFHLGVAVETVAFQKVLAGMLEEMTTALGMYPLVIEVPRGQAMDKIKRAMLPAHLAQLGLVVFPFNVPGLDYKTMQLCMDELVSFPRGDEHDDFVDAFTDCVHILHSYSLQLGRGLFGTDAVRELLSGRYGYKSSDTRAQEIISNMNLPGERPLAAAHFGGGTGLPLQWQTETMMADRSGTAA